MAKQTHLDIQLLSRLAGEAGKALVLAAQGDAPGAGQSLTRFRSTQEHLLENLQKEFLSPLDPEDAASLAASLESAASAALLWARWQTLCPPEGNIPLAGASGLAVRLETAAAGLCGNKKQAEEHILRLQTLLLQTTKNAEQFILSLPGLCRRTPELLLSLEAAGHLRRCLHSLAQAAQAMERICLKE